MKRTITLLILLLQVFLVHGQDNAPFMPVEAPAAHPADGNIRVYRTMALSREKFETIRAAIPRVEGRNMLRTGSAVVELPLASGAPARFFIGERPLLSDELARQYPNIKTYDLRSTDGTMTGRVTYSQLGLSAMLLTPEGTQYIVPFSNEGTLLHAVYFKRDYQPAEGAVIRCGADDVEAITAAVKEKTTAPLGDCMLRTYNFAVAATGEFTNWAGSQANALASITATVANVSLIFERDLGIHLTLVSNNSVLFTNPATDPYATVSFPSQTELDANTTTLNSNIGSANYDLGMLFHAGWNGGLAYTPAICNSLTKGGAAAGVTGNPSGSIMENVVAHEVGHMFNARHTMSSGTDASCTSNLNLPTAYEIGGGSTIMAYAGAVCAGMAYQNNTDDYFHYNSVSVIRTYAQGQSACGTATATSNAAPSLTVAVSSYTIPHSTPFELSGSGLDLNPGDFLTYTFEQYDAAAAAMTTPPPTTATTGPMFRSYPPTTSNTRIFPALPNILSNTSSNWEVLPSVTRTLNFRLLARDNHTGNGCVAQESVAVQVNAGAGPFSITSQNTASAFTANGSNTMTITWNVASTNAAPVSSPNVDILFSTDNGQTFPYVLAAGTPNDGTETVIVPNLNTANGRIKVKSANNIFFDINNDKLTLTSTCAANGSTFSPSAAVNATAGDPALNLNLTPNYGSVMTISGNITTSDPTADLAVVNVAPAACISFSNEFRYDLYSFQVNVAGSYTFTPSGGAPFGMIMNLYEGSFVPGSPCTNFVNSNGVFSGTVSINGSFTASLAPGITYQLAVGTFSNTLPTVPFSYTVGVSGPAGGNIYSGVPNPGPGFNYRWVIVNTVTGNIVAIVSTPDLTSTATYPAGWYAVFGLSVSTSVSQATLNTYAGGSFAAFQTALLNNTICGNLSTNSLSVTINAPLHLQSLKLSAVPAGEGVDLQWVARGEEQTTEFVVERSQTGNNFEPIGMVPAEHKGIYAFTDNGPYKGMNYYRIRATETGGGVKYSNIAKVHGNTMAQGTALVYPNPVTAEATVQLAVAADYDCSLTDVSGRLIRSFREQESTFVLDMSKLTPGIYILECRSKEHRTVSRIVKQ